MTPLRKGDAAIMVCTSRSTAAFGQNAVASSVYTTATFIRIAAATRDGRATRYHYAKPGGQPMRIDEHAKLLRIPADIVDVEACQAAVVERTDWLAGWDSLEEARDFVAQFRTAA